MGMKGESYSRVCLQGSSQSLPGVKGVENVGITPCQALGGFLTSSVPVNLFIYSATIILHLFIKPGHNRVSSSQLSCGKISSSANISSRGLIQKLDPLAVFLSPN